MADIEDQRTPWFPRSTLPVWRGVYECKVVVSRSLPPILWGLEWDGRGFLVPFPMVVLEWRGLLAKPRGVGHG